MRFASLGSGSEGNGLVVQVGATNVLMDCGFSLTDTYARLARIGLTPDCINGIVVTHEHSDHIAGVAQLARKHSIPIWLTHGTMRAHPKLMNNPPRLTQINSDHSFAIGGLLVKPYAVPHDAAEPVQYVFSDGTKRLGVLTDTGCSTPHIETMLNGCDALVLECNHDVTMLANSNYPLSLKKRIGGRFGHLNNTDAAALLARLDCSRLQHVVAAHLSQKNNTQKLAADALSGALNCDPSWIAMATQNNGLTWREIS